VKLWSVLHDREHWGDPEVFRPERFLDADGRFIKDEFMVKFGAGKRVCFGETLARNMLFLVFSTLMQEFIFKIPEGDPTPQQTQFQVAQQNPNLSGWKYSKDSL
jgi:methyl farnesoate epoxidase/farnesoate epoxidase